MRLSIAIVVSGACLLAGRAACAAPPHSLAGSDATATAAERRILVQDRFLDDTNRAALLCRAGRHLSAAGSCRSHVPVPGWFSNRLLSVIGRGGEAMEGARKAPDTDVLLPVYEMVGDHPEHQDRHVNGANQGALVEGHVGVVYLEGDGDFVLTDTATGAERREPIRPGKLISWPNAGFTHRVEGASAGRRRRMLGPMAFDAASHALVGVGDPITNCTALTGYECVTPEPVMRETWTDSYQCSSCCNSVYGYVWSTFDSQNTVCYCLSSICTAFVPGPTYSTLGWNLSPSNCPALVIADPVVIAATGSGPAPPGGPISLLVALTVPAGGGRRLQAEDEGRELKGWASHKPLNTTNYALLVTVPAGGAANVTYKRTHVSPRLKPASLKKPVVQSNGDLLWPTVPMPVYQNKNSTRKFKVVFRVAKSATSPLVFGTSVWKGGVKIANSAPITVTLRSK